VGILAAVDQPLHFGGASQVSFAEVILGAWTSVDYTEIPSVQPSGKANEINGHIRASRLCEKQVLLA